MRSIWTLFALLPLVAGTTLAQAAECTIDNTRYEVRQAPNAATDKTDTTVLVSRKGYWARIDFIGPSKTPTVGSDSDGRSLARDQNQSSYFAQLAAQADACRTAKLSALSTER